MNVLGPVKLIYSLLFGIPMQRGPGSHEILIFVCLQQDAKQCCDVTMLEYTHCYGWWLERLVHHSLYIRIRHHNISLVSFLTIKPQNL